MKRIINNIWQQFNRNDILPKIASLLLAIIVWAYISSTKIGEIKVRIPINFENLSKALLITEVETGYISLALSGKKEDLKNINKKDFKIIVNLENPIIGKYKKYQVEVIKADIPENIDMSLLKKGTLPLRLGVHGEYKYPKSSFHIHQYSPNLRVLGVSVVKTAFLQ